MRVTMLGLGGGAPGELTTAAREALEHADAVIGAARLLEALPHVDGQRRIAAQRAEDIAELVSREDARELCAVFSGDTGFHSGARLLLPLLRERGIECLVLPGISSAQLLASRLERPWQDWTLCSAHGADCDPVAAVLRGKPAFFLTGGARTPAALCAELTDAGLGGTRVTVGENLSCAEERVLETTAEACALMRFAPLSVLLVEAAPCPEHPVGGLADDLFARGDVPMTKQEVRAAVLAKLELRRTDVLWDVGAGTGSVSVELALAARQGRVWAVERNETACGLIEENRRRFGAWNLRVVHGEAPEALAALPAPDGVFLGGSGGRLREIVGTAFAKNPAARLCVSAVTMETVSAAAGTFEEMGIPYEATQISVARSREMGGAHLLTANNPVFLIASKRRAEP